MKSLSRMQKTILAVLAIMDFVVIGGLGWVVVSSMRTPPPAMLAPTPTSAATRIVRPEWTPTPTFTPRPTNLPRLTNTPTPTATPRPTQTATPIPPTPTPAPIVLMNADFDLVMPNRMPGWQWDAYVNYKPGDDLNPEDSYAEPYFEAADDPVREINGTTVKVETVRWVKFRTWVHQTITVTAGSSVYFQFKANAFSSLDRLIVKAGIDPTGPENCYDAQWGKEERINQDDGIVTLISPRVTVPEAQGLAEETEEVVEHGEEAPVKPPEDLLPAKLGRVTVCIFVEPTYPHVNNAAFFDQAELIAK